MTPCRSYQYRQVREAIVTDMLMILDSCSRQSRMENFPCSNFFAKSFCRSGLARAMSCLQKVSHVL